MKDNRGKQRKVSPSFVIKIDGEQGIVEHTVAVMGNVDLGGDRIHNGAFTKTISERAGKIRVLDSHNSDSVLGVLGKPLALWEIGRDELPADVRARYPDATGALMARTQFLMDTPEGKGAFTRIRDGALGEYSIGYDSIQEDYTDELIDEKQQSIRNLKEIRLWEYSPVSFAMNPATSTLSAKGDDGILGDSALPGGALLNQDAPRYVGADPISEKIKDRESACKAVNLSAQMHAIVGSFYTAHPDTAELTYWVDEVWSDYLIVNKEAMEGSTFWRVPFTIFGTDEQQSFAFASSEQWTQIEQVWIPVGEKRVTIVNNYYGETPDDEQKKTAPAPDEQAATGNEPVAGPNDSSPTKEEELAEIETLLATIQRELSEDERESQRMA